MAGKLGIAGLQQGKPERFEGFGEITNVVPGQNKFDLQTRSGELLEITVSDRQTDAAPTDLG